MLMDPDVLLADFADAAACAEIPASPVLVCLPVLHTVRGRTGAALTPIVTQTTLKWRGSAQDITVGLESAMPDVTFENLPTDLGVQVTTKMPTADGGSARVAIAGGVATVVYDDGSNFVFKVVGATLPPEDTVGVAMSVVDILKGLAKDIMHVGGGGGIKSCTGTSTTVVEGGKVTVTNTYTCTAA